MFNSGRISINPPLWGSQSHGINQALLGGGLARQPEFNTMRKGLAQYYSCKIVQRVKTMCENGPGVALV